MRTTVATILTTMMLARKILYQVMGDHQGWEAPSLPYLSSNGLPVTWVEAEAGGADLVLEVLMGIVVVFGFV